LTASMGRCRREGLPPPEPGVIEGGSESSVGVTPTILPQAGQV